MAGKRAWELEHGFYAFFYSKEHPQAYSVRDVAEMLEKDYGKSYSKSTISNMVASVTEMLATDPVAKDGYEKFKQEQTQSKYFWKMGADGKIESPYESVRHKAEQVMSKKGHYTDNLLTQLRHGEKFWQFLGRKKPDDWTESDLNKYLASGLVKQGSKFGVTVACRQFCKKLKDIDDATQGLKGVPRIPSILKIKEFPQIFTQIKAKALELTPIDQRAEMEFILRIKPAVGIRTGRADRGKGLWGTKIGAPWKNQYGNNASHIQVVGNTLIWHVLEKMNEEWDINFLTEEDRAYIINFVKARKTGDFLISTITQVEANRIIAQACEALGIEKLVLHDMRKIYISFLVRAGIPLEKAIKLNVGWKDIATAFKHYLAFSDLGEKEEIFKKRLGGLLRASGPVTNMPPPPPPKESAEESEDDDEDDEEEGAE